MPPSQQLSPLRTLLVFLLILVAAAGLRFSFPGDIEFKYDEHYMFEQSRTVGVSESWPGLGMASGAGPRNPGMSVWIFAGLARVFSADDPVALARTVQVLGVVAVALLLFIAARIARPGERETWVWTAALAAVNPFAVLFQRKIWAQCTLPFFSTVFLIGWLRRDRWWGAFVWGLTGACLGQIHMSGFYFAAAFLVCTAAFSRYFKDSPRVCWRGWFAGSALGAIPLLPWIQYMIMSSAAPDGIGWGSVLKLTYWRYWVTDPFGLGLDYSLGAERFRDFLEYPLYHGSPTYLVGVAHVVALGCCGYLLSTRVLRFLKHKIRDWGGDEELGLIAAMFGCGTLMSLSRIAIMRHYLIVAFPFEFYWVARMARLDGERGRKVFMALIMAEFAITSFFLYYIHVNHGAAGGDYGAAYQFQQK